MPTLYQLPGDRKKGSFSSCYEGKVVIVHLNLWASRPHEELIKISLDPPPEFLSQ